MFDLRGKKEKSHVSAAVIMRLGIAQDFNSVQKTDHSTVCACVASAYLHMFGLLGHVNFNKSKHHSH